MCFKIKIKSALFLMFWKRNIFLERMNNKKCGGTMFVRMMLNKPINVNFERIMHIWFAEILKEMKAAVNQLIAFNFSPIYYSFFYKLIFLNIFLFVFQNFSMRTNIHKPFSFMYNSGLHLWYFVYVCLFCSKIQSWKWYKTFRKLNVKKTKSKDLCGIRSLKSNRDEKYIYLKTIPV